MKTKIIIGLAAMLALTVSALEFTAGEVPKVDVPVTYSLSRDEMIEAVKVAIRNKYPNADVSSTNVSMFAYDNQPCSNCVKVAFAQIRFLVQPTIVIPKEVVVATNAVNWFYINK